MTTNFLLLSSRAPPRCIVDNKVVVLSDPPYLLPCGACLPTLPLQPIFVLRCALARVHTHTHTCKHVFKIQMQVRTHAMCTCTQTSTAHKHAHAHAHVHGCPNKVAVLPGMMTKTFCCFPPERPRGALLITKLSCCLTHHVHFAHHTHHAHHAHHAHHSWAPALDPFHYACPPTHPSARPPARRPDAGPCVSSLTWLRTRSTT